MASDGGLRGAVQAGGRPPSYLAWRLIGHFTDAAFRGKSEALGINPYDLTPERACDLIFWWLQENCDAKEWDKVRAKLEVPPPGYTGSLAGTVWDHDEMLAGYEQ